MRAGLAGILSCSCLLAALAPAASAAVDPAAQTVGHKFVNEAYRRSRLSALPAALSAQEAEIALQFANQADPENAHTLKLLVEAAAATGDNDVRREALRNLIRLDPGDLVAQVQYIDFMASGTQAIDERARIYGGALGKKALDPQVRSEMAVRLAGIAAERGDVDGARGYLKQALQLNDVNVEALQELAGTLQKPEDRMAALVALLTANPLQPAAWVQTAQLLEAGNANGQAADFLITAIEQIQLSGEQPPPDIYLALGMDLGISGRRVEAYPILNGLAKLPDAPLNALVAARLLQEEYTPPTSMQGAASQPSGDDLEAAIRKRLTDAMNAAPKSPAPLADAIWIELSVLPQVDAVVDGWLKSYEELVSANDPTVIRFQGWQLLRAGKLDEAKAMLEKAAGADPFSQLGLARVLIAQKKFTEAAQQLQDLWWTHPTGLFAFQIAQTARQAGGQGIKLSDTMSTQQLLAIVKQLPSNAPLAHREPRDLQLITTELDKRAYDVGDPAWLSVRINNTTDRTVPVGPDGLIKCTVGLLARVTGVDGQNLGVVGIENLQRVYRLERRGEVDATIRVDQGKINDLFEFAPLQTMSLSLALVTAPQGTTQNAAPGLGGQIVAVGGLQRNAFQMTLPRDVPKLIQDATTATGQQQLIRTRMLAVAAAMLSDEAQSASHVQQESADDAAAREKARDKADAALLTLMQSPSPMMRVYLLLTAPTVGMGVAGEKLMGMSSDPDRLVRAAWADRQASTAETGSGDSDAALVALRRQGDAEQDPLVRQWISALLDEIKEVAAHPTTQPE